MNQEQLHGIADRLVDVSGVVAVLLGGSRARGDHRPDSDFDLGLYYEPPLDVDALAELAHELAGAGAAVTTPGQWGPWVDGGAWLTINGSRVDWIYRNLHRVVTAWRDAQYGKFYFHGQVGHPLGVPDFAYPGELALGILLADPTGQVRALQEQTRQYPPALAEALVKELDEATFLIANAEKVVPSKDSTYVAGCLFRVVGLCAHAVHGAARRWLVNEKGCVASAARLPTAPPDFAARCHALMANIGGDDAELANTLERAAQLVAATKEACARRLTC